EALEKLVDEDPTFKVHEDEETGETIIRGMGELHLDIIRDRLEREFNVGVRLGRPQVVYRETVMRAAEGEARFERMVQKNAVEGGKGSKARAQGGGQARSAGSGQASKAEEKQEMLLVFGAAKVRVAPRPRGA